MTARLSGRRLKGIDAAQRSERGLVAQSGRVIPGRDEQCRRGLRPDAEATQNSVGGQLRQVGELLVECVQFLVQRVLASRQ